jgi:hypothetical protein
MLLRKGELHRLIDHVSLPSIPTEVKEKLDLLAQLFCPAASHEEVELGKS